MAQQSAAALRDLAALLGEVASAHDGADGDDAVDGIDGVDGIRSALHLLCAATDHVLEGDPERPFFSRIVSPTRKILGDNPDALYYWARIRGDRRYRVTGALADAVYTSFTIHARDPAGGARERVTADLNDRGLELGPDGRYEIVLGGPARPGNWMPLDPEATTIITRHYFGGLEPAAADPETWVPVHIEPLQDPGPAPPLSDAALAERLQALVAWVRAESVGRPAASSLPAFVSAVPNQLPVPASFGDSGVRAWGAVDIFYASGRFELGPDEALVIDGWLPRCAFANVVLWNRFMQTLDYRHRTTSLNHDQLVRDADGGWRVVVAAEDPGVPNWLDTEGRSHGTIFWRFVLPDREPPPLRTRVVPVAEVAGGAGPPPRDHS